MYKYKKQFGHMRHMGPIYTNNLNVNNVTNVAYLPGYGHSGKPKRRHDGCGRKRGDRPPKLLRYSASCGFLDGDLVSKMSNEELCCESVKTLGYAANKFGSCVCGIGHDVLGIGQELVNMTCLVGKYLFGG